MNISTFIEPSDLSTKKAASGASPRHLLRRRRFLQDAFCGFGALALVGLLEQDKLRAARTGPDFARQPRKPAAANSVIFLFMGGGPSHLETFDPKPLLTRLHGQPRPAEFGKVTYQFVTPDAKLLGPRRSFRRHGQSGIEISDLFPCLGECVDDLAFIRSCYGDKPLHAAAQYELFTGRLKAGHPSMGSWILYGLGSETQSLPGYVVLPDPRGALMAGQPMFSNGFLPSVFQPTMLRPGAKPVLNLGLPDGVSLLQRQKTVDLIRKLNQDSVASEDEELEARVAAFELAFRMQTEAPEVFDLSRESSETRELYGIGIEPTDDYGRRCLLARRLVEKGVRFICVVSGGGRQHWDAHGDVDKNHVRQALRTDKSIAGLLADLKRRGLLDTTLVLWGGEFGRSPEAQNGKGRDHHHLGFTMWMAGGGIRGGQTIGATDDIGFRALNHRCHFRDIHATLLDRLGLDADQLSYIYQGRQERLTFLPGKVIRQLE